MQRQTMQAEGRLRFLSIMLGTIALLLTAVMALAGAAADADGLAPVSPYGEVEHFGGFDSNATLEKFVYPVGFAVVPKETDGEENDVYVLDRLSSNGEVESGRLQYRLQKLASNEADGHHVGEVLGSVTLPPETFEEITGNFKNANPLISLAVDPEEHRVYALVEGSVNSGEFLHVPAAQRLVAWSTLPVNKKLERADPTEFPEDALTGGSLIAGAESGASELEPAEVSHDLDVPEGIVVAPDHDVVIEAQEGDSETKGGPTILQSVTTTAPGGKLAAKWVASGGVAPVSQQADGLFTTTAGFGVDLYGGFGGISRLVDVNESLTAPSAIAEDKSGGVNLDEAPTISGRKTVNSNGETNDLFTVEAYAAGSPIAQLTNSLYAARFGVGEGADARDFQTHGSPWGELPAFWFQGEANDQSIGNVGIRLFKDSGEVVTTIGGEGPCKLETSQLSVVAGSKESVFVLTQPNGENGNKGDEVIEFAPGGPGACPVPSGKIMVGEAGNEQAVEANGTVEVHQNVPVKFNASSFDRKGESPFAFVWDYGDGSAPFETKMESTKYLWPSPEAEEHKYGVEGFDQASMTLSGDYGTVTVPFTVDVLGTEAPVAAFTFPASIVAGEPVTFTSTSRPTGGSKISFYHWEFSDNGEKPVTGQGETTVKHTFESAGEYEVTLTVDDEGSGQDSAPVKEKVTVVAASSNQCLTNCGVVTAPNPPPVSPPVISPPLVNTPPPPPPPVKPLTNAQKLTKALTACKKDKPKHKRAECEKAAKAKYGPKKKKSKTKKKK